MEVTEGKATGDSLAMHPRELRPASSRPVPGLSSTKKLDAVPQLYAQSLYVYSPIIECSRLHQVLILASGSAPSMLHATPLRMQ